MHYAITENYILKIIANEETGISTAYYYYNIEDGNALYYPNLSINNIT